MLRLRELRLDNDIKQIEIARFLSITQQQYSLYEKEIRSLPIDLLILLCKFYSVSSDYILGLTDKKQ